MDDGNGGPHRMPSRGVVNEHVIPQQVLPYPSKETRSAKLASEPFLQVQRRHMCCLPWKLQSSQCTKKWRVGA